MLGETTMRSARLAARIGFAVVDAARARAERRVGRSCIVEGVEEQGDGIESFRDVDRFYRCLEY